MESIEKWIKDNLKEDCYDDCPGYDDDYDDGSGYGNGFGYDAGYDFNYGYGIGCGAGYGASDGHGQGEGGVEGIKSFKGMGVYVIDGVQTVIEHIKDTYAKGYILNSDFTLEPCYIAKGQGYFAHEKTLKNAKSALELKIFRDMDSEEAIEKFIETFKKDNKYSGKKLFEWHHYLTGSCLVGRKVFVKNKGLDINKLYTVDEFISICENEYGGKVIKKLKKKYQDTYG